MTSQKYEQTRSCGKCGYEETRFLGELTTAFKETRISEKAEEFGESLWYLRSYLREAFEKHQS